MPIFKLMMFFKIEILKAKKMYTGTKSRSSSSISYKYVLENPHERYIIVFLNLRNDSIVIFNL
jgi:hypothetical protein